MTSATQGPIPIIRSGETTNSNAMHDGTPMARTNTSGSYLGLSAGLSGSASFREAMAVSFGKDVADLLEYSIGRFSSSTDSDATVAGPSSVRLESTFCRNFTCCGKELDDLHDLLQHYEECHVRFEDDDTESMVTDEDMDDASMTTEASASSQHPTAAAPLAGTTDVGMSNSSVDEEMPSARSRPLISSTINNTPMVSTTNENLEYPSAFDTAVMCSPSGRGKKRTHGQQAGGSSSNPLFRALLENGGRHPLSMSGTYSSPFSSPGTSRAGTPSIDSENEAFLGSTTQPTIFSNLNIRGNAADDQLPSCAPPNLFFPSANVASLQRPVKRERFGPITTPSTPSTPTTANFSGSSTSAADNSTSEHRPYKCPAPGCDKAYKQMNGLKYHRLHGHCNQNLRNVNSGNATSSPNTVTTASSTQGSTAQKPSTPNILGAGVTSASASSNDTSIGTPGPVLGSGDATAKSDFKPDSPQSDVIMTGISTPAQGLFSSLNYGTPLGSPTAPNKQEPVSVSPAKNLNNAQPDKMYVCQVGNCDKRYKNLNGLRYHYLHSGSHGLLGLQLLHANGGGASAKADSVSGRPPVSTDTLSREQIVQAAAAAQALLSQQGANCNKGPNGNTNPNLTAAAFLSSVTNNNAAIAMANAEPL